jgi:hypothetical protein
MIKVFSITYHQDQVADFEPIDNSHIKTIEQKSYLFEYNPILKIVPAFNDKDYYGIFSWKFKQKTGIENVIELLEKNNYKEYDIINLCKPLPRPYIEFTDDYHIGFIDIFEPLCEDLGIELKEPTHHIYSNFFICKGEIYKEYAKILTEAINLLETKYKVLSWRYCRYNGLEPKQLKVFTGLNHYTFHTFVLERMMSVWANDKYKILDIIK